MYSWTARSLSWFRNNPSGFNFQIFSFLDRVWFFLSRRFSYYVFSILRESTGRGISPSEILILTFQNENFRPTLSSSSFRLDRRRWQPIAKIGQCFPLHQTRRSFRATPGTFCWSMWMNTIRQWLWHRILHIFSSESSDGNHLWTVWQPSSRFHFPDVS